MDSQIPGPAQLRTTPQLASLGVLSEAIAGAIHALQAAYPELYLDDDDLEISHLADRSLLAAAESIVFCAEALGGSVNWYWSETIPQKPRPSPFER